MLGKKIFTSAFSPFSEGEQVIQFKIPNIAPGYYILKLTQKEKVIGVQKLIVE